MNGKFMSPVSKKYINGKLLNKNRIVKLAKYVILLNGNIYLILKEGKE